MKKVVGNLLGTPIVECSSLNELEENEIGYIKGIPEPSTLDTKYYGCVSLYKRENGIVRSITHGCAAFKYHADKADEYIKKTYGEGCRMDWESTGDGFKFLGIGDFISYINKDLRLYFRIEDPYLPLNDSMDSFMVLALPRLNKSNLGLFLYEVNNFSADVVNSNYDIVGSITLIDFCTPISIEEFWNPDRK